MDDAAVLDLDEKYAKSTMLNKDIVDRKSVAVIRSVRACAAAVLLLSYASICASGSTTPAVREIPSQIAATVQSALRAVNQHRPELMASFAAPANTGSFGWTASRAHDWKGGILPVPGYARPSPRYLAVFHTFHTCESDGDHVYPLVQVEIGGASGWKLGPEIRESDTLGLRVRDHSIDAGIVVSTRTLNIKDTVEVERTAASASTGPAVGLLRLNEPFRVRSLRIPGAQDDVPYSQVGGIIAFVPPAIDKFKLTLQYDGVLDQRNGDYIHDDEAVIASYWYPHIARLPATLSIRATAPPGWTTVAQGEQLSSKLTANGSQETSWRNEIPVSFFTLDMGKYKVMSRQWKGKLLSAYTLESSESSGTRVAKDSLDLLQDSLAYYEKTFGPFPYSRYSVVETRGPFNGALEAYSFATFGPRTLPGFIPHELSHTWWGGLVPCTYTHSMWNEAFANYADDLYSRAAKAGGQGSGEPDVVVAPRPEVRRNSSRQYTALPVALAFDTEDESQNSVGYDKGAQVLRALEEQIGAEAMQAAIRWFLTHRQRGEPAEWPEFEAAASHVAGEDLHWFFHQWLDQPGLPVVSVSNLTARRQGGGVIVTGRIKQFGATYRMRIPVAVELRSGAVVHQVVEVKDADAPFSLSIPGVPDRFVLDPEAVMPIAPANNANGQGDPFTIVFQ